MYLYEHGKNSDNDLRVIAWWDHMRRAGDLARTFGREVTLSSFLDIWKTERLTFDTDELDQICVATWFTPFMDAALFGLWVRADRRQSPSTLRGIVTSFQAVFEHTSLIISVTPHAAIVPELGRLGYVVLGAIPGLIGPGDAYAGYVTNQAFEAARAGLGLAREAA